MRWGVRDEATDDHMTSHLCLNEIDNCQRLSLGPNFVVCFIFNMLASKFIFIGQKSNTSFMDDPLENSWLKVTFVMKGVFGSKVWISANTKHSSCEHGGSSQGNHGRTSTRRQATNRSMVQKGRK